MDLQSRKIEFIQEFLKLQSEEVISKLEKILRKEKGTAHDNEFKQMTEEELNKRIDKSESDFENDRFKSSADLVAKYDK